LATTVAVPFIETFAKCKTQPTPGAQTAITATVAAAPTLEVQAAITATFTAAIMFTVGYLVPENTAGPGSVKAAQQGAPGKAN
jgi:hypothetical protein